MSRCGIVAQDAYFARLGRLRGNSRVDHLVERAVEVVDHLFPGDVPLGDAVELLLDIGREVVVDDRSELGLEVVVHYHADVGGREPVLLLAAVFREGLVRNPVARERQLQVGALLSLLALLDHVAAVDDRRDGRGVGRRTADAEFLEPFDERSLVVAGRRGRKALRGRDLRRKHAVAGRELGQQPLAALGALVVGG